MPVNVILSTTLRNCVPGYQPAIGLSLEWTKALSVRELAEKLNLPLDEIKIVMLNGRHASFEHKIHDGDRIGFFPAVGGG
ncbi:MAG: MoaD/ThiS family protein [Deltaproteobacteria bacterium]|jgi:molybdopterin converting factor small subunit|nr:MoaD/ThiS family protein [Deltaproteobacteria bacterium]